MHMSETHVDGAIEAKKVEKKKVGAGFGVILERDGKILMGRRHPDPEKADSAFRSAGEWTLPGGKLDWGETFEAGAAREVLEETGMQVAESDLDVVSVLNCMNEHAHFMTVILHATSWQGEASVCEPDEITEWGWFDLDDLPTPLYFPSKLGIENFVKGAFYIKR